MFTGHKDFSRVMSRDAFETIRAYIKFRSNTDDEHDLASQDPLCRSLLQHFQKHCAEIAVPYGTSALDENTARTKARTSARSYIKGKPDPYGIRFYAVVGWKNLYLSSIWDNGSGNTSGVPQAQAYCTIFRNLRGAYNKVFDENSIVM